MKSKLITVFVAAALSTIGLCSTLSYAGEKTFIIDAAYNSTNKINLLKVNTIDKMISKPLLSLYSSDVVDYISEQKFTKKNEIFELATIFNDKLQHILARLPFNESSQNKNIFINTDKPNNDDAINCSNK